MGFLLLTVVLGGVGIAGATAEGRLRAIRLVMTTSFLLVWVSPMLTPAVAHTCRDLDALRFGGPIRFLEQKTPYTPPDQAFPLHFDRMLNPQEYPTRILWGRLGLSVLLMATPIWALWAVIASLHRRLSGGGTTAG